MIHTVEEWEQECNLVLQLLVVEAVKANGSDLVQRDCLWVHQWNGDREINVGFSAGSWLWDWCFTAIDRDKSRVGTLRNVWRKGLEVHVQVLLGVCIRVEFQNAECVLWSVGGSLGDVVQGADTVDCDLQSAGSERVGGVSKRSTSHWLAAIWLGVRVLRIAVARSTWNGSAGGIGGAARVRAAEDVCNLITASKGPLCQWWRKAHTWFDIVDMSRNVFWEVVSVPRPLESPEDSDIWLLTHHIQFLQSHHEPRIRDTQLPTNLLPVSREC